MNTDKHAGAKYQQGRDTAEIAKLFRADVKALIAKGELPKGLKLSVRVRRFAGGSSIDVDVTACPGIEVANPAYVLCVEAIPNRFVPNLWNWTTASKALVKQLETVLEAYNRSEIDTQSDYFNVKFYGRVGIDSDFMRAERSKIVAAHSELIREVRDVTSKCDMNMALAQCLSVAA